MRKSGDRLESQPVEFVIVEDDDFEQEHVHLNKRSRLSIMAPAEYNTLYEPGPVGLNLRKSPSFLDLIQMRLTDSGDRRAETLQAAPVGATMAPRCIEKQKASNFLATVLKIGQWEYKARYVGNLVAKCYFAKQKLVWEVLEHGLKSKIEIQWSDIMALKADFPEDGPGTLTIVLDRQPLFFRETNPQPRKHTFWEATSDFTCGQASKNRLHVLQCAQGIMDKHFEKLIHADGRLLHLSRQPQIVMDSPYFVLPSISGAQNLVSPVGSQSSSGLMYLSQEAPSPSSVIDLQETVNSRNTTGQNGVPGLHQSMSLSDFVALLCDPKTTTDPSQVEQVSELHQSMSVSDFVALVSDSRSISDSSQIEVPALGLSMSVSDFLGFLSDSDGGDHPVQNTLEIYRQGFLGDDIELDTPDEKSLMARVNSLLNLVSNNNSNSSVVLDPSSSSKPQGMLREDSFSDLLLHLPRIASLPKFLPNI